MAFTTRISVLDGIGFCDDEAWRQFYDLYSPLIRLHGRDCGIPPDWDDDLIQEVSVAVVNAAEEGSWNLKQTTFRNYLRGIIRHKSYSLIRGHYRSDRRIPWETEVSSTELDQLWEEEWQMHIRKRALYLLRETLPPRHFQIFELMNIHCWRGLRVARFLGLPLPTVYSINLRTLAKLRLILREIEA